MRQTFSADDVRTLIICLLVLLGFALVFPKFKSLLDEWVDRKYLQKEKPEKEKLKKADEAAAEEKR